MYPMYDYAHPLSDAIEGLPIPCTLEFQDHRPFYDWVVEKFILQLYRVNMSHHV